MIDHVFTRATWRAGLVAAIATLSATIAQPALGAIGPIDFKSREAKEGRNFAKRIIATLAVGKSSGQATYEFDFDLPAGRGVSPSLALSYSSTAGVSEVGEGWALSVPMIERGYEHGPPSFDDAVDVFKFRAGHDAQELVATGEVLAPGWTVFREKTERSFSLYLRKDNTWRVLHKDGTRLELGTSPASRRGLGARATSAETAAWLVTRIVDTHGNEAFYQYEAGRGQNALLSRIDYTGNPAAGLLPQHHVQLVWENHFASNDRRVVSLRKGYFENFGLERLAAVRVTAAPLPMTGSPAQVPATSPSEILYTLTHDSSSNGDPGLRLTRIQVGTLPPMEFEYQRPWAGGTAIDNSETWTAALDPLAMPQSLGRTLTDEDDVTRTVAAFADVDGDGRADLIDTATECHDNDGDWIIWKNRGGSFIRETWNAPELPTLSARDACAVRVTERIGDTTLTWQELIDFTGDGVPDVVFWDAATMFICRGTGDGFAPCTVWGALPSGVTAGTFRRESSHFGNLTVTDVDLVDFNGDGFVDRVSTSVASSPPTVNVVLNNKGMGWGALTSHAMPGCGVPGFSACLRLTERLASGADNRRMLVEIRDVNGDSLPDILTTVLATGLVQVAFGTGAAFQTSQVPHNGPATLGVGRESSGGDYRAHFDLVDVNGDGLPDIVEMPSGANELMVRYNVGGSWAANLHTYPIPADPGSAGFAGRSLGNVVAIDEEQADMRAGLFDISGDGIPELVTAELPTGGSGGNSGRIRVSRLSYRAPHVLLVASSLANATWTRMSYAPLSGEVPFPMHVVNVMTRQRTPVYLGESVRQTRIETKYTYEDAVYDPIEREFRGFHQVTSKDVDYGTETVTTFLTGPHTTGLIESEISSNVEGDGVPTTTLNEYTEITLTPGSVFVRADRRQVLDGTLFEWRLRETVFGDYIFGSPGMTRDSDPLAPGQDVTTVVGHVVRRDSDHLLVLPSRVTRLVQDAIVGDTRNYYDDRTQHGVPPTRGNLVRSRQRRSMAISIDHHAYYDDETTPGVGVLLVYVDPEGTTTSYGYDPVYRQFPTVETTPLGTMHRSYHALFGVIADVCGPQSSAGTWRCARTEIDAVGRPTARHVPVLESGTFALRLMETISYDETTYPMTMRSVLRPGAPDAARTLQYLDGFGQVVQSRIEETPSVFRVVDSSSDALGMVRWTSQPRREVGETYHATGDWGRYATRMEYDYVRGAVERRYLPRDAGDPRPQAVVSRLHHGTHITDTDELGRVTDYMLDGFGRVRERIHRAPTGDATVSYDFDRNGHVASVVDPNGLTTEYLYDDLGWLLQTKLADGSLHQFLHNSRGQVIEHTDPRGVVNRTEHDGAGRVERVHTIASPPNISPIDETTTYYDASQPAFLGWIATQTAGGFTYRNTYDGGGRATGMTLAGPGMSVAVTQEYTADGRLRRVYYGDSWAVAYDQYLDGSARRVTEIGTGRILGETALDDNGRPSVTVGIGLEQTFTYDARGRVTHAVSSNLNYGSDPLVDDTLEWSDASELTALRRAGMAPGLNPRSAPEEYVIQRDWFGRLAGVTRDGNPFASYDYDLGGLVQQFNEDAETFTYSYEKDRMVTRTSASVEASYDYDAGGSVVSERIDGNNPRTRTFVWDAAGRLEAVGASDQQGDRSTTYTYVGGALARVYHEEPGSASDIYHVGNQ